MPRVFLEKIVAYSMRSVISAAHVTGNDAILFYSDICGCQNSGEAILL